MFSHWRKLAVVASAAIAFAGCGSDDSGSSSVATSSTGENEKAAKVAFVTYTYTDYAQAEEQGIKEAVTPNGGSVTVFNANFDPQKVQKQCSDAVSSQRYNAIVLAPVDSVSGAPCAKVAEAAGIPVVSLETPVGDDPNAVEPQLPGVVGAVVQGPVASAEALLPVVRDACEGKDPCRIVAEEVPGDPFSTTMNRVVEEQLPNAEIVQKFNGMYDPATVAKVMPDVVSANPDIDVLLAITDGDALAAVPALRSAGLLGQVNIVGAGGSREAAKAVKDGTMFGTTGTWPIQAGRIAGEMAIKAVNGQTIENPGVNSLTIDTPPRVTPETVDEFTAEWGAVA